MSDKRIAEDEKKNSCFEGPPKAPGASPSYSHEEERREENASEALEEKGRVSARRSNFVDDGKKKTQRSRERSGRLSETARTTEKKNPVTAKRPNVTIHGPAASRKLGIRNYTYPRLSADVRCRSILEVRRLGPRKGAPRK